MNIGTGYGNQAGSRESGRQAARQTLQTGGIEAPSPVLAFRSGRTDALAIFKGLSEKVQEVLRKRCL